MADDPIINFNRPTTLFYEKSSTEITVRMGDWKRIRRKVQNICPTLAKRELFAGIAFGITPASIITLLPLYALDDKTAPWVKPALIFIGISSAIIGIVLLWGGADEAKNVRNEKAEILLEMTEVESQCGLTKATQQTTVQPEAQD